MADLVGQVETIRLPGITDKAVKARIDTGARTSAIWASKITKTKAGLQITFFGGKHRAVNTLVFKNYSTVLVLSSNGISEKRYKVRLSIEIAGRRIRAWFTLADRSKQTYPILVGRNILRGKFVVDVSKSAKNSQKSASITNKVTGGNKAKI